MVQTWNLPDVTCYPVIISRYLVLEYIPASPKYLLPGTYWVHTWCQREAGCIIKSCSPVYIDFLCTYWVLT